MEYTLKNDERKKLLSELVHSDLVPGINYRTVYISPSVSVDMDIQLEVETDMPFHFLGVESEQKVKRVMVLDGKILFFADGELYTIPLAENFLLEIEKQLFKFLHF